MSRQWQTMMAYLLAALFYMLLAPGALAQTTSNTVVDFGPLWNYLVPFVIAGVGAFISAVLAWGAARLRKVTGLDIDAAHRDTLKSAIVTGLNMALERVGPDIAKMSSIDVKSRLVAQTLDWVVNVGAKDAVAHFDLKPETISKMILGYIQVADPTAPSIPAPAPAAAPTVPVK